MAFIMLLGVLGALMLSQVIWDNPVMIFGVGFLGFCTYLCLAVLWKTVTMIGVN